MKHRVVTAALVVSLGALTYAGLSARSIAQTADAPQKSALEEKVERLEKQVAALEKQVEELKNRPATITLTQPMTPQPYPLNPGIQNAPNLPPGAIPREFNGMTYYVIPLQEGDGKDNTTVTTAKPELNLITPSPAAPAR